MHRNDAHTQVVLQSTWKLRPVASHLRQNPLEALMQGEGDVDDLGGAVVGRDGLKAKGVAHNERGGVSWKAADVATVAEVYSPALAAMMDREGLPARRRTPSASSLGRRVAA